MVDSSISMGTSDSGHAWVARSGVCEIFLNQAGLDAGFRVETIHLDPDETAMKRAV